MYFLIYWYITVARLSSFPVHHVIKIYTVTAKLFFFSAARNDTDHIYRAGYDKFTD